MLRAAFRNVGFRKNELEDKENKCVGECLKVKGSEHRGVVTHLAVYLLVIPLWYEASEGPPQ